MNIVVLGGKEPARASLAPPPNNHQEAAPPAGEGRPLLLITGAEKERGLPCHRQKRMSARGKSRLGMNGFSASAGGDYSSRPRTNETHDQREETNK